MSATDFPPQCKYKNYLANNVHVSCIFFKNLSLFQIYPLRIESFFIICPYLHVLHLFECEDMYFLRKTEGTVQPFLPFRFFHNILIITADELCKHEYLSDSDSILFDVSPQAIIKKLGLSCPKESFNFCQG